MISSFLGLETARRALQAQQIALDVTSHNISNANTQGYTRQIVNMRASYPIEFQRLQLGTGVDVAEITRSRDAFVDRQFRYETSREQYWASQLETLSKIETIMNEPSENSLRSDLDKFWNAWSELSKDPESLAARTVVNESALNLINTFHNIADDVKEIQNILDNNTRVQIKQINDYAKQLAELNRQIAQLETRGTKPNDLYDKRDALIDDLSKLVNVKVVEKTDAELGIKQLSVIIGDAAATPQQVLVDGGTTHLLKEFAIPADDGEAYATIEWEDGTNAGNTDVWGNTVRLGEKFGSLLGIIEARGDQNGAQGYLAEFMSEIDTLARGVADAVNALHQKGQDLNGDTGEAFFVSSNVELIGAANIQLNANIKNDIYKIAAANYDSTGINSGDGTIALAISSLAEGWAALDENSIPIPVSAPSFLAYYNAGISKIATDVQQAERMQATQAVLVSHMLNQRDSMSAVSLDEEMVNLVKYQKSYSAAARIVTIIDSMLDTIVNGMGVTR